MNFEYSKELDEKWQKIWQDNNLYKFNKENIDNKIYLLEMFSYPSASQLHLGHWWNYSLPDSWGRMKRMQGYNVFHPMGFDAFGLPAENYAIKTGIHPKDSTYANIDTMINQLKKIGATYDWDYLTITCDPEYYKWTQWLFLKLYEHGLAYQKKAPTNWCPSCKTVLANEQVINGKCERCGSKVIQKSLLQWFFKITKYADDLVDNLKNIDWPEKTKNIQRNWIGRSYGAQITFKCIDINESIDIFTTRPDTLMGVSYVVLAPENPLVEKITKAKYKHGVEEYVSNTLLKTEIDRLSTANDKTGVFTGTYVRHPITGKSIPVWISDYVLASYGTGAVMAVPAHDERDYAFANNYNLPILKVIECNELPYIGEGVLCNSGEFNGLQSKEAVDSIVSKLKSLGLGEYKTNFRLRDWLVSRQRYWGAPIPIIYCDHCGIVPVPEKDLPVKLPYNVKFTPNGESPLSTCDEFVKTVCPICGAPARRETDTLDTFVCSSWYYLRYYDTKNSNTPWDLKHESNMMPVDLYVGGVEHAAMHLLYARFIYKALHDMGLVSGAEPFQKLIHQGVILGSDGQKMSKSKGNTVLPDAYIDIYGADVFRMYLAFGFSYTEGGPWSDKGIAAIAGFFKKISRILQEFMSHCFDSTQINTDDSYEIVMNRTIKAVTEDMERFSFNTAVARLMEYRSAIAMYQSQKNRNKQFEKLLIENFVLLMSPLAPHYAEEIWSNLGHNDSIFNEQWPKYDSSKVNFKQVEIVIQVNGKIREKIFIEMDSPKSDVEDKVFKLPSICQLLKDKQIKKVIYIQNKLFNIVI